jgi:FMN-dependent dehydrogenase
MVGSSHEMAIRAGPHAYALAAGGKPAVIRMPELLEDEARRSLALLGVSTFAELDRSNLHPTRPTTSPGVLSAFPLLNIEDDRCWGPRLVSGYRRLSGSTHRLVGPLS